MRDAYCSIRVFLYSNVKLDQFPLASLCLTGFISLFFLARYDHIRPMLNES